MWEYKKDDKKWVRKSDNLTLETFEFFKKEFDSFRFYSKCLSGSTYVPVNDINNIYDILTDYNPTTWYISPTASQYAISNIPSQSAKPINNTTSEEYYDKFNREYGLTLKNLFTPKRIIKDSIKNFLEVDVATTEQIDNLQNLEENLRIDGIRLKEGHRILVKDQKTSITISNQTDPNEFFKGEFELIRTIGLNSTYEFYNESNGIYKFTGNQLVRESDLDVYDSCVRFSVVIKLGSVNSGKQFHLSRLNSGYYPTTKDSEPIHFKEKKNWLIRNQVDYNNLFDINYNSLIKHEEQSYTFNSVNYTIPERVIAIGDFGVIINHQSGVSNIIRNKYKVKLNNISQTEKYYWIVGDKGILLKVRKHDFNIERVDVDCTCNISNINTNLKSISFYNNLNGVAVGDINTILITSDGGLSWKRHMIKSFNAFNYNSVNFKELNNFYVGGNNGVFIEFMRDNSGWKAYKRRISKFINSEDEFLLVENINHILPVKIDSNNPWNLSYRFGNNSDSVEKDLLFLVTDNNNIIVHDLNNSIPFHTEFMYLEFRLKDYGDIKFIERKRDTNEFYFIGFDQSTDESGIFSFNLSQFDIIGIGSEESNRILTNSSAEYESDYYPNFLFDYRGEELLIAGNNSILESSIYSQNFDFSPLDQSFESKLKSRLLFLDYEAAGKLNFFTNDGEYRLPEPIEFSLTPLNGEFIEFSPLTINTGSPSFINKTQLSWWQYLQDSKSTFEYYATSSEMTDSTKVMPSGIFSYNENNELQALSVATSYSDIQNLAPTINIDNHSRFSGVGYNSISAPTNSYDIYLYDYLMVIRYSSQDILLEKGDIINLKSDSLSENFMVNKVLNISGINYAYLFTEFNESIIKDIENSSVVTIKNLNKFSDLEDLENKFNNHLISDGYKLSINNGLVSIESKFNDKTSYYNLQTEIITNSDSYSMRYVDSFLNFGYKPTYNILDYLEYLNESTVNPQFFANKEYLSMPHYNGIPISTQSKPVSECYIDYNKKSNNKLIFGKELEFEWNSIFINTFVDINIDGIETEKLLVIKKYYDSEDNVYVIEFHKSLNYTQGTQPLIINIRSRRSLIEISDDLQYLNNIQTVYKQKSYTVSNSIQAFDVDFQSLEKDLNFKINTDSYAKILLSDYDTVRLLSGIVYTDDKGELSLNITNLESKNSIEILNTSNFSGNLFITTRKKHNLSTGEGVVLEFNGGEGSSQELNNQYFGYRIVNYIDDFSFYVDVSYGNNVLVGNDSGFVNYIKRDPFLNFLPVDIIDVGIDKMTKISVELSQDNTELVGDSYKLVNVDYSKYRFRLIDGLDIEKLAINYDWIYEAEISSAIIGKDNKGLVWYNGIWECGRWFGGTWISGTWISGDWYSGIWKSRDIKDNFISVEIEEQSDNNSSIWFTGRWFSGEWESGTWVSGRWYDGIWHNGQWYDGIWNGGDWKNGEFSGGVWVDGKWKSGSFSTLNAPAYWINGDWYSGDFENGMWFNGNFGSKDNKSRFGTKSYNSRLSIWKSGNWINGSFHSRLNIDEDNDISVSDIHKYSVWESGNWFNGDFYGGVAYNIDFKSGTWYGGILEEKDIIGITSVSNNNYFTISGLHNYNTGYIISIIDNGVGSSYSSLGSNSSPGFYTVLYSIEDIQSNTTKIYVDRELGFNFMGETNLKLVSRFRNCNWKSGLWTNGIYDNGLWEGGIWYNGIFSATWT